MPLAVKYLSVCYAWNLVAEISRTFRIAAVVFYRYFIRVNIQCSVSVLDNCLISHGLGLNSGVAILVTFRNPYQKLLCSILRGKPDPPDLLQSSRRCPAITRLEACSRPTSYHMDPSDPPGHGNIGDWCSRAGWGQIVLAANRNGGMLRLIASRHDDDDFTWLSYLLAELRLRNI